MNLSGVFVGILAFLIIGIFHPIVVKLEYYYSKKVWPVYLVAGIISCVVSLLVHQPIISPVLAVLGFTCFWSIKETFEQEERVQKAWFPANPDKLHRYFDQHQQENYEYVHEYRNDNKIYVPSTYKGKK